MSASNSATSRETEEKAPVCGVIRNMSHKIFVGCVGVQLLLEYVKRGQTRENVSPKLIFIFNLAVNAL